jgi:hypothetical protein
MEKEAEQLGQQVDKRWSKGLDWPPGAFPKQLQLASTKAEFPGPFNGYQTPFHAALSDYKHVQFEKPNNPGTASGKPQQEALLLQSQLKLLQAQMFWHSTSFYKSLKQPWLCSYGPTRIVSMPS